MLVLGSLLALLSGMLNAAAAGLEKREGMRTAPGHHGARLMLALLRRPPWLLAIVLSALAWIAEAVALAVSPIPVVATLRNAGRGLLVVGGGRWLAETFTWPELAGVGLAGAGGVLTAIGAAHSAVVLKPLGNLTVTGVGAVCAIAAFAVSRGAYRLAASRRRGAEPGSAAPRRSNTAGVAIGAAVGILYAGTGVFTKEISDRFALHGLGGLRLALTSPSPWLMVVLAIWGQSLVQQAFRRANAASVSAANASVASLGLIFAGFTLYREGLPRGSGAILLTVGIVVALAGTVLLLAARPASKPDATKVSDAPTEGGSPGDFPATGPLAGVDPPQSGSSVTGG